MKTLLLLLSIVIATHSFAADSKKKAKNPVEMPLDVRIERDVSYLAEGRKELADLYSPLESPKGAKRPAVVWIHGGGWNGGQRDAKREINVCSTLARNGYVAMSIDYKLTYGKSAVWPNNLGDCKTAVRWLRKNAERLGIDSDHIGVMGGSAGGHLASMVALTTAKDGFDPAEPYGDVSCAVSCCVDMYGITDISKYHDAKMLGKTIAEAPELYRSASPLTYVRKDSVPFLILHGTADTTVNIEQSKWLDEALTKAGVEHELVIIPDAPHTFDLEPAQRDLRPVVLAFLDKHLKGKKTTAVSSEPPASGASKPNIVLFISDQHFADAMGCAGDSFVKTPALDSLAATGVRFRNTYCTYPVCMGSRASLMTGLWPHQLGATDDEGPSDKGKKSGKASRLEAATSLATLMRQAGYETAYFGKWHVGSSSAKPGNAWHGFDVIDDGRVDETTANQAIEFIQRKHDKPFFLIVSFLNPHDICEWARLRSGIHNKMLNGEIAIEPPVEICPALPPNFAISADEPEVVTLRRKSQPTRAHPTGEWGETQWRQYRWAYAKLIEKMDQQLGRVVSTLDASGQRDSTLIAYTSDHGDGNGAHHWNQKMVLYEEAIRIPLILSWPGHTPAGKVETHLTSMGLDLLPTFCDYAGIQTPSELAGHSLKPWADQALTPPTPPKVVVTEVQYSGLLPDAKLVHGLLLRSADFAYINYSAGKNPEQLFDMRKDPGQITNLAQGADHQNVLAEHRKLMREWVSQTKSPFPLKQIP